MSEQDQQAEPSMEEILASIRRIISEDGDEKSGAEATAAEPPAEPDPAPESEPKAEAVAEVEAEAVAEVEAEAEPEPEPEQEVAADEAVLDLTDEVVEEAPNVEAPPAPAEEHDLMSIKAETAAAKTFSELASATQVNLASFPIGDGSHTLEEIVREMIRPLLKDWLDQNLPPLVERLVSAEVRRVSGGH